ncbi:hypothetical protein N9489_05515 [Methylophilaceae bacterium]|nr:hypothetical protein [Methylophilaceae bacterium]
MKISFKEWSPSEKALHVIEWSRSDSFVDYKKYNTVFCDYFFSGSNKGRPVRLDISDEVKEIISTKLDINSKDIDQHFINTVKAINLNDIYRISQEWDTEYLANHEPLRPPFIAILCFFSFVAESMTRDEQYASNNYYGRLQDFLEYPDKDNLQRIFYKFDHVWSMLNSWLDSWEKELGLPTAYALDFRRHVSIPMSQALIRDHDRLRLYKIFEDAELSPGEELDTKVMEQLIRSWYKEDEDTYYLGQHSQHLLKLMDRPITREAALDAACHELLLWDGKIDSDKPGGEEDKKEKSRRLFYTAKLENPNRYNSNSKPEIKLNLCGFENKGSTGYFNLILDRLSEGKKDIFKSFENKIQFEEYISFIRLVSSSPFPHGDGIISSLTFINNEQNYKLTRQKRSTPICILTEDLELGVHFYREVSRVQRGVNTLLLVWYSLQDKVKNFLDKAALPDYEILTDEQLHKLPKNFIAFRNVKIINELNGDDLEGLEGLEDLSPQGSGCIINFLNGLYLEKNTYLINRLPEIEIFSPTAKKVTVKYIDGKIIFEGILKDESLSITINNSDLLSGEYQILIDDKIEKKFWLKSSNDSRINKMLTNVMGHHLHQDIPLNSISATKEVVDQSTHTVIGNFFLNKPNVTREFKRKEIPNKITHFENLVTPSDYVEEVEVATKTQIINLDAFPFSVGDRISHHEDGDCIYEGVSIIEKIENMKCLFMRELTNTDIKRGIDGKQWKYYSIERIHEFNTSDNEGALSSLSHPLKKLSKARTFQLHISENQEITKQNINFNLERIQISKNKQEDFSLNDIFNALCFLKEGTFDKFCNILDSFKTDIGFQWGFLKSLSSLGHIDIEYNLDTLRPKTWRICNPCVKNIDKQTMFLSGWRSPEFIKTITEKCIDVGAQVTSESNSDTIDKLLIKGLKPEDVEDIAKIVSQESNFPLQASISFPTHLLNFLPSLNEIKDSLNKVAMPEERLERAVIVNNQIKFESVDGEIKKGAYRSSNFGTRYFFLTQDKSESTEAIRCDVKLAKYFAFQSQYKDWFTYNPDTLSLTLPIHMELPFLYERLVVSLSGQLPETINNQLSYKNVSLEIAEGLANKLFGEI